ncbi:unnamed protein product [Callosobruchus maculatus]|uniref:C2H2-type domain-containing protein n=1 Tax=Callosobruchus maculatus TaxID=64391 RepID=A0A653BX97_CALMS|nr:unnamed protein product [Callosobruchus maculatus]
MKVHQNKKKVFGCDPSSSNSRGSRICLQCNAIFKLQISLDDHIVRTHPNFISAVTRKIHECTLCAFKTTRSSSFNKHLSKHRETNTERSTCTHCTATFKNKISLDDHIIKNHPNFVSSVTSKIHKCTNCTFATTRTNDLKRHLLRYSETPKPHTCLHCTAVFKWKVSLDHHTMKKHPNFISSVTSKIHKCTNCSYTTLVSSDLKIHLIRHTQTPANHLLATCEFCRVAFKRKRSLDDHIIKKHPNFVSSVTSKIHECILCTFKTTVRGSFNKHLLIHPETNASQLITCTHCTATFKNKISLDDHIIRKHPNFVSSVTSKIHECTLCAFKTTRSSSFNKHLLIHPETNSTQLITCTHCTATFKNKISLDDHIIRKHPNFVSSVTRKIHECTLCAFKTTRSSSFNKHLLIHPETNSTQLITCTHCTATFKNKISLDDHIIRKHPNFVSSVTSKIHECTLCAFKTTVRGSFNKHLLIHPETNSTQLITCTHCTATFKNKISLDDHIIRKHPNFVSSVTSKIHECTLCAFKTTVRASFNKHLLIHPETNASQLITCTHCTATFKNKISLDDHIIRKHPNFVSSVTSKIHECTLCAFKTTRSSSFNKHLLIHPETNSTQLITCTHCTATFKNKISLDDHIIRKHPNFVSSVTRKIHECTLCAFKTTVRGSFNKHLLIHPETNSTQLITCTHCTATFKNKISLDDHIIRKHPNFVSSVTSKIHECTLCAFKTTVRGSFNKHLLIHPETNASQLITCTHCTATFKKKISLDDHIIRKHPNFVSSVTSKIHECTLCAFKTTRSSSFNKHLLIHPETNSTQLITCTHCTATFKNKISLDDHIIKKHPNFVSSVTRKIHKCTKCSFKTTIATQLKKHSLKHTPRP